MVASKTVNSEDKHLNPPLNNGPKWSKCYYGNAHALPTSIGMKRSRLYTNYLNDFTECSFKLLQNVTWLSLDYLWLMPIKYSVTYKVTSNECIAGNG